MSTHEFADRDEGKTLEYKVSLQSKERIIRSLVAFANTAGGTLVVGIADRSKKVVGLSDPIAAELQMANMIADSVTPHLIPDIQIKRCEGRYLLVVEVGRSPNAPHFVKSEGAHKGIYVRVGSTNRVADAALVSELRRSLLHQSYDETPLSDLTEDDLDQKALRDDFKELRSLRSKDLETLGIVTKYQRKCVPTVGGILMYGRERLRRFPDAWIQAGVFAGPDRADVIDSSDITSCVPRAVTEVLAFVKRNLARAMHIGEVKRVDRYEIPLAAIREAVINAVVHADYTQRGSPIRVALYVDRLEVDSPGLLPFGLTVEEMQQGVSKIRNRVISRVCKELGLIEQWGSGVQRINAICRAAQLKPPRYEELGASFRVTLYKGRVEPPKSRTIEVDSIKEDIISYLQDQGPQSTHRIAAHIQRSTRTARQHLRELLVRGLIAERGTGPRDPHKVYELVKGARSRGSRSGS